VARICATRPIPSMLFLRAAEFRQHARQTRRDSRLELWLSATEQIAQEALDMGSILWSVHDIVSMRIA
jgi:hypothetical protein